MGNKPTSPKGSPIFVDEPELSSGVSKAMLQHLAEALYLFNQGRTCHSAIWPPNQKQYKRLKKRDKMKADPENYKLAESIYGK